MSIRGYQLMLSGYGLRTRGCALKLRGVEMASQGPWLRGYGWGYGCKLRGYDRPLLRDYGLGVNWDGLGVKATDWGRRAMA